MPCVLVVVVYLNLNLLWPPWKFAEVPWLRTTGLTSSHIFMQEISPANNDKASWRTSDLEAWSVSLSLGKICDRLL